MSGPKDTKLEDGVVDTVSLEEKLGPSLIREIAEKEWKTAPLPTQEELDKEKHKSPKARSNVNSRKNLNQYREKVPTETKEKIVKGLSVRKKRREVKPFDYIELPEEIDKKNFLSFLPRRKVFVDDMEEESFYRILNIFLKDFDPDELKASDIEAIISLAKNKVIEDRLLASVNNKENSPDSTTALLDVSASIEKLRKHSEKVKEGLASRRSDRIDPRSKQNFSIVDIVQAFDDKRKAELKALSERFLREEETFLEAKKNTEDV